MKKILAQLALVAMPLVSIAAPNPVSWDKMVEYVNSTMTLTQADWKAACTGNPNSTEGCYGNAGSQAFAKINRLSGNPLGYAGAKGSAPHSLWIRQVGEGTTCSATDEPLSIENTSTVENSTIWICGVQLTDGSSVSLARNLGALIDNAAYTPSTPSGILFATISSGNMVQGAVTTLKDPLYFLNSPIQPTAYVFCISTDTSSNIAAFQQVPMAAMNSGVC